ncbi:PepSY-associated TM helix domain-containing protein [Glacieibacterium sp.]|uniref:PepSY-associated TM helix domain-containing protein n=1 Tax=Glacieibacterium sp. TaxID=2860237 RepID=UPI003AFFEB16
MIALPKRETKRLVAIHGWSGIVLGLLLYAVVLTGTVAVFASEIGQWSSGTTETRSPLTGPVDATLRKLIAATPAQYREEASLYATETNQLAVFLHGHVKNAKGAAIDRGVLWQADRSGRVLSRHEGDGEDVFGPDNDSALAHFLVDLHVRLHLPNPWGLLLTGVLGMAMLVAAISGVLIHRHLFKDIFTLRRRAAPGTVARDRHNVAGTWSLPFAFVLAFTGSFFSFAGSFGLPALAMVAFGGNQQVMSEVLFGVAPAADARPVGAANLDRIIADATRRTAVAPNFISMTRVGRADASMTLYHAPREGRLATTALIYSGATGAFQGEKPVLGTKPSFGGKLYDLMAPLHFGNFAGALSKAVWFGLGFATCYVVFTGMQLWLRRREANAPKLERLDRLVTVIGFGLPFALSASALGYLLASPSDGAVYWTPASFIIASMLAIGGAMLVDAARLGWWLRLGTGVLLVGLPVIRLTLGGPGWDDALAAGQPLLIAVDIGLALAGGAFLRSLRNGSMAPVRSRDASLVPAE